MRFSMPGMPISTIPAVPSSKIDLICSRLFIWRRSASSTRIRVVGSDTARCLAWYCLYVSKYVGSTAGLQNHRRFPPNRVEYDTHHSLPRHLDVVFDPGGSIDHRSCIKQGIDRAIVCYFACPAVAQNDLICAAVAHSGECFANAGWSIVRNLRIGKCSRQRCAHLAMWL